MHNYRYPPSTETALTTEIQPLFTSNSNKYAPLSYIQRAGIVTLFKDGQSKPDIANKIGTSLPTVRHWIHHYNEKKNVENEKRSGRKRKTTTEQDDEILRYADDVKFTTPHQIKTALQLHVSDDTIDRRLIENGLFGRVARHKHKYTNEQIVKRMSFANGYLDWSDEKWDTVLFSDEKIFYGGITTERYVRRPMGEALNPEYMLDHKSHPIKVNVWACFSGRGLGYIYIFNETLDGKLLKRILNNNLIPSARLYYAQDPPEVWWVEHDNDKKFTGKIVSKWIHDHGIKVIDLPAYSPDCNPIENLWYELELKVEKHNAKTIDELQDAIAYEWTQISKQYLQKLSHSMHKRCEAVIAAKGQHTAY